MTLLRTITTSVSLLSRLFIPSRSSSLRSDHDYLEIYNFRLFRRSTADFFAVHYDEQR